jgi:hypothetical protein
MGELFLQMDLPLAPCPAVRHGAWQPAQGREVRLRSHAMVGLWVCNLDEFSPPTQDLRIPFRLLVRLFDYLDREIVHGGSYYQFQLAALTYRPFTEHRLWKCQVRCGQAGRAPERNEWDFNGRPYRNIRHLCHIFIPLWGSISYLYLSCEFFFLLSNLCAKP